MELPDDVALLIASRFSDKRDLQGALIRLVIRASMTSWSWRCKITLPNTQKLLEKFVAGGACPRIKRLL